MTTVEAKKHLTTHAFTVRQQDFLENAVKKSWDIIAPFWPLENLIAVNPLQGLEDLPIEEALTKSAVYFQRRDLPTQMEGINRETIKWLQAFFDKGQATLNMPFRQEGLFASWLKLALHDKQLHKKKRHKIAWLRSVDSDPHLALEMCLKEFTIPKKETTSFLTLLLTTLPGWAGHLKYLSEWAPSKQDHTFDYLAMRAVMTYVLWPDARTLIKWYQTALQQADTQKSPLSQIEKAEARYRRPLLEEMATQKVAARHTPSVQLAFCIDVRSEPFRRAIESLGDYETFGFAGFFGVPAQITDPTSGESYASCPVLLSPKHDVKEQTCCARKSREGHERLTLLKRLYQSIKYTFAAPFGLVEGLGIFTGIYLALKTFAPGLANRLRQAGRNAIHQPSAVTPSLEEISFEERCAYGEGALRMMGLTDHFAPLVVFCGHGSKTENNAFASSLDCGACGGRHGSSNARILASILNDVDVRAHLKDNGIEIPQKTQFIGATHYTTTDEVSLHTTDDSDLLNMLKRDLKIAGEQNNACRLEKMEGGKKCTVHRSEDWAQVRPEWGLAGNAAIVVAPRGLTRSLNLEGRCFLHSYDADADVDGKYLETILTAPMVVAQWINSQYLFSTLDNASYGGGSKITKNITGKMGIMQGNASDLMTGLPLQSVYKNDETPYHELQRLMTVVYAPTERIDQIIEKQPVLQKLFGNGWVQLTCIDPSTRAVSYLQRDLSWKASE